MMNNFLTFPQFLTNQLQPGDVADRLGPAIDDLDAASFEDPNNLFAVSPHFLKLCTGEPQEILEALVIAYNSWIFFCLRSMTEPLDRCMTANRVIFVEGAKEEDAQIALWQGMNASLASIAASLEELIVNHNYVAVSRHAKQREE